MITSVSFAFCSFFTCLAASNEAVHFSIIPDKTEVHPQEPLGLAISLKIQKFKERDVRAAFVNDDNIVLRVYNTEGAVVAESSQRKWDCAEHNLWLAKFDESKEHTASAQFVFNEWCSTAMPSGHYKAVCDINTLGIVYRGENISATEAFSPPVRAEFSFNVLESDDLAVQRRYEALFAIASNIVDYSKRQDEMGKAVELIAYSREQAALPCQLKLLTGIVPMYRTIFDYCTAIELASYLVELDQPDAAKGLLNVYADLENGYVHREWRQLLMELVSWSIHEMYARGNPEIVSLTESFIATHAKGPDPLGFIDPVLVRQREQGSRKGK